MAVKRRQTILAILLVSESLATWVKFFIMVIQAILLRYHSKFYCCDS